MNAFWREGREIIKKLIDEGFDAYFSRDAVLDRFLDREISLIWIVTTANFLTIKKLFPDSLDLSNYKDAVIISKDGRTFVLESLKFDLTNVAPDPKGHYSTVIIDGLGNMEYTIDAPIISYSDKRFDPFFGLIDLQKRNLNFIGDPQERIENDPFIILKGLRLMAKYGVVWSKRDEKQIRRLSHVLVRLSFKDYAFFLEEITKGEFSYLAFRRMYNLGIQKYLPQFEYAIEILSSTKQKVSFEEFLLLAAVINNFIDPEYAFYIRNYDFFKKTKHLAVANPSCKYDALTLFTFGLEACLLANKMNALIKNCHRKTWLIKYKFKKLKIKSRTDLVFKEEDILKITDRDGEYLSDLIDEICFNILKGKLKNEYLEVKDFVLKRLPELGIDIISDEKYKPIYEYNEDELTDLRDIDRDSFMEKLKIANSEKTLYDALKKQGKVLKRICENQNKNFDKHAEIDYYIYQKIDEVLRLNFLSTTSAKRFEIMSNLFNDYVKLLNNFGEKNAEN